MEILLPCGVVERLSRLNRTLPASESREWLKSLFVECRSGHMIVGSTNSMFAAIEYAGVTSNPDSFIVVKHDPQVLDGVIWCNPEDKIKIEDWPELNFCSVTPPFYGYKSTCDAAIRDPEAIRLLRGWRDWLPDEIPAKPGRSMFLNVDSMAALCASSPSGRVVFPHFIDANQAIIVRDVTSPNWLGCFLAKPESGIFLDGATMPEWVVK